MIVQIWGGRGSTPSPLRPSEVEDKIVRAIYGMPATIDTDDLESVKAYVNQLPVLHRGTAGGNTTCVQVEASGETIIVDAGSGLRQLGLELMKGPCGRGEGVLHFLISHLHWDHIQGFPMFVPAFIPGNHFYFHSIHDLEPVLVRQQDFVTWPVSLQAQSPDIPHMNADLTFIRHEVGEKFNIGRVQITSSLNHHPGNSYAYRIADSGGVFVFASDAEYKDLSSESVQERIEFCRNADILLFDAQYGLRESWESKADWGHSSAMIGVDMARRAGVKTLLLSHHEPTYSDVKLQEILDTARAYQQQGADLPACNVMLAYEGLVLDLAPSGTLDMQMQPETDTTVLRADAKALGETGASQFEEIIAQLASGDLLASTILDLSQVERLTTADLQRLVSLSRKFKDAPLAIAAPSEQARKVMELGGYGDYFAIYASVEAATEAVEARRQLQLPGQIIDGRYRIERLLGQGRLGTVLSAYDTQEARAVVLKLLSPAFSYETISRIISQVERIVTLRHGHILSMVGWGLVDDRLYLIEEFARGQTLKKHLQGGSLPLADVQRLVIEALEALVYAHNKGVLHGNMKPDDIFLDGQGGVISNFGRGYIEQGRNLLEKPPLVLEPAYLAPEQILGHSVDARADLYSLGVVLYEMIAGIRPFEVPTDEVLNAHINQSPEPLRDIMPSISRALEHFVLKLLEKNPNSRYASAEQALKAFRSLVSGRDDVDRGASRQLFGRDDALVALNNLWQTAQSGYGQLAFVTGEPGVGKSTLVTSAAARSSAPVVLVGRCSPELQEQPFRPFLQILGDYFATAPSEVFDSEMQQVIGNLSVLVPDIEEVVPGIRTPVALEPQQEQIRLLSSFTQFLKSVTGKRPWYIVLEDLQWIDEGSAELLLYLGRYIPEMALMIVGTFRPSFAADSGPLSAVLLDLQKLPGYRTVRLPQLTQEQVAAMLSDRWGDDIPGELVSGIFEKTDGNPLFIEEVASRLEEDKQVYISGGQWHYPDMLNVRFPRSFVEVIEDRLSMLNSDTLNVLAQAAVLGQTFHLDDLVAMSHLSEWEVIEHLQSGLERQLVRELSKAGDLQFCHIEIQEIIYNDLGVLRRRNLHRSAAQMLMQRGSALSETVLADDLAYHWRLAGDREQECYYSILAGQYAAERFASKEAVRFYSRALELTPEDDYEQQFAILLKRQAVNDITGNNAARSHDLGLLGELADMLGKSEYTAVVSLKYAAYYAAVGDYPRIITHAQNAADAAKLSGDRVMEAEAYTHWGNSLSHRGQFVEAQPYFEKSLAIAVEIANDQLEIEALLQLCRMSHDIGQYEALIMYAEQILSTARRLQLPSAEFQGLSWLATAQARSARYRQSIELYNDALAIARDIGVPQYEALSLQRIGVTHNFFGDYQQGRRFLELGLERQRIVGDKDAVANCLFNLGVCSRELGEYDRAYREFNEALTNYSIIRYRLMEGYLHRNLGKTAFAEEDYAKARIYFREALAIHSEIRVTAQVTEDRAEIAWTSLMLGEPYRDDIEAVLKYLDAEPELENNAERIFRVYLSAIYCLRDMKDPRADQLVEQAYDILQRRAVRIEDDVMRASFLENIPDQALLVRLYYEYKTR